MTTNVGLTGFLLIFVTAFTLLHHATSEEYDVLGTRGWIIPDNGAEAYRQWTVGKNFEVGDTLVFKFTTASHDVAKVSKEEYENCSAPNQSSIITEGPARITLPAMGEHYFICTFGTHCKSGQKLAINVTDNDSDTETPSGSPTATTPPMTTTPRNSASHAVTGSFALALLIISTIFLH